MVKKMKIKHIYIEEKILNHTNTQRILKHFPQAHQIIITDYRDLFNRHQQNFMAQKARQSLILAACKQDYYYKASSNCENYGHTRFYYTNVMMNCFYDCSYCYLKSIYNCGHFLIFVNNDAIINQIETNLLIDPSPLYLAISYNSDFFAFDQLTHFMPSWLTLARHYQNLTLEVKTKSPHFMLTKTPPKNVIFAWSLLPQSIINQYEQHTPSLTSRMEAINKALKMGATVRLSLEPLIPSDNSDKIYTDFICDLRNKIDFSKVDSINVGGFRISAQQMKNFTKKDPYAPVFAWPFVRTQTTVHYKAEASLLKIIKKALEEDQKTTKIYFFDE